MLISCMCASMIGPLITCSLLCNEVVIPQSLSRWHLSQLVATSPSFSAYAETSCPQLDVNVIACILSFDPYRFSLTINFSEVVLPNTLSYFLDPSYTKVCTAVGDQIAGAKIASCFDSVYPKTVCNLQPDPHCVNSEVVWTPCLMNFSTTSSTNFPVARICFRFDR